MTQTFQIVVTAVLVMLLTPSSALAAMPGANGKIAFQGPIAGERYGDGIYVVDPDGSNRAEVVPRDGVNDTFRGQPAWSPDGTRLAFARTVNGNTDIYVMAPDGSDVERITDHPAEDEDPAWSPDGCKLVFQSARSGHLYVTNLRSGKTRRLTRGSGGAGSPEWSPDGRRIAFAVGGRRSSGIHSIRPNGKGRKRLTRDGGGDPTWSPDGRRIAWVASRPDVAVGAERVFVMRRNGTRERVLQAPEAIPDSNGCDDECYLDYPSWAPDGTEIAFVMITEIDLMTRIVVTRLDDGEDRVVVEQGVEDSLWFTAWQPLHP